MNAGGPMIISERTKKIAFGALLLLSFIGIFPLSLRIADPLATRKFDPLINTRVLLLWPDHIELRPIGALNDFSPRPGNAAYTFLIPRDREVWVRDRLRSYPDHARDASWIIAVKELGPDRQRIQLEILGDGFWGMVYEANAARVIPLGTRLAGPLCGFVILGIHPACWGGFRLAVFLLRRLLRPSNRKVITSASSV
jgi:hypothetical protein